MKKKMNKRLYAVILSAAMVFTTVCPAMATESVEADAAALYEDVSVEEEAEVLAEEIYAPGFDEDKAFGEPAEEDTNGVRVLYAIPDVSGNAAGTKTDPIDLATALSNAQAGDEIHIPEGNYKCDETFKVGASGTEQSHIKLVGEGKVFLDFSGHPNHEGLDADNNSYPKDNGIKLTGSYWDISGIEIYRAPGVGLQISGSYNTVTDCRFSFNRDSGLQISGGGDKMADWAHDNYVLNCTSHDNCDDFRPKFGEDADGFAAKIQLGSNNVFSGCISYCNSDDGWDLYAKDDNFPNEACTIINCVAFGNGYLSDGSTTKSGDGNGFKLGSSDWAVPNRVKNCLAFDNLGHGFTDNNNSAPIELKMCTSYNNGKDNTNDPCFISDRLAGGDSGVKGSVSGKKNYMFNLERNGESSDLLSVYSTSFAPNGMDMINGTIDHSVLYDNGSYHITDTVAIDSSAIPGEKLAVALDPSVFISVNVPAYAATDFDTIWRDANGDLALGNLFKVETASPFATWSSTGKALGADLSSGVYVDFGDVPAKTSYQYNETRLAGKSIIIPKGGKILNLSDYQIDGGKFPNPSKTPAIPATFGNDDFKVMAGTGKQLTLQDAKGEVDFAFFEDGESANFKKRLAMNSDPGVCDEGYLARCVEFTVPEKTSSQINVIAYADKGGGQLTLYKADGTQVDENIKTALKAGTMTNCSFTVETPGKYYIGTKKFQNNTYLYYIQQIDTPIPDPEPEPEPEAVVVTEKEKAQKAQSEGRGSTGDTAVLTASGDGKTYALEVKDQTVSSDQVLTVNKGDKVTLTGYDKKSLVLDPTYKKTLSINGKGVLKAKKITDSTGVKFSYTINGGSTKVNMTLAIKDPAVNVSANGLAKPMKKLNAEVYENTEFDISFDMPYTAKLIPGKAKNKSAVVFYDDKGAAIADMNSFKFVVGSDLKLHVKGKSASKGSCSIPFTAYGKKYTLKIKTVVKK